MEYKMKCNTCGKVYCYDDNDLKNNSKNGFLTAVSALGGIASAIGGTGLQTAYLNNQTEKYSDKIKNYNKCPYCNSSDVSFMFGDVSQDMEQGTNALYKKIEVNANATPESIIKRVELFLEDGEWEYASVYADACLDIEPENSYAYVCKLMAELKIKKMDELEDCKDPFDTNKNFQKAVRFADEELKVRLNGYIATINERNKSAEIDTLYNEALTKMNEAKTEKEFEKAANAFNLVLEYKDSIDKQRICCEKAEEARKNSIYNSAKEKMASNSLEYMQDAVVLFESILDWKDCSDLIIKCRDKIENKIAENERISNENQIRAERNKMILKVTTPIVVAVIAFVIVLNSVIIPNKNYNKGIEYMQCQEYSKAISVFNDLNGYKDSAANLIECRYQYALQLIESGDLRPAIAELYKTLTYQNSNNLIKEISGIDKISAQGNYTTAIKSNGTIIGTFDDNVNIDTSSLVDLKAIANTIGIKADGTVVVNPEHVWANELSKWDNMIEISIGFNHIVGLKNDGSVVAVGDNSIGECDVSNWKDIVAISAGGYYTVGLKSDGTVVATGYNESGGCDVHSWNNIVAITTGTSHTVGLKSDGTVVATGGDKSGLQCAVEGWDNIIGIAAGNANTVGLKLDGTVVVTGYDARDFNVGDWEDIIAIRSSGFHAVGLKSDGTVVATGANKNGQCNVQGWNLFE